MDSEKSNRSLEEVSERTTADVLLDVIRLEDARQNAEDRYAELSRAFKRGEIAPEDYHYQTAIIAEYEIANIDTKLKATTGEVNTLEGIPTKRQTRLGGFVTKLLRRG
ncbi:MAG: hypothetical protein ACREGE_00285 [Candidatus Microsaccharimonas sp.]